MKEEDLSKFRIINISLGWGKSNYISYENKLLSFSIGVDNKGNEFLVFLQSEYSKNIYYEYMKIKNNKKIFSSNNNYFGRVMINENKINVYNKKNDINLQILLKNVEEYYPNIYVIKNLYNEYVY